MTEEEQRAWMDRYLANGVDFMRVFSECVIEKRFERAEKKAA